MRTLPRLIYLVVVYAMLLLSARAATDVSAAPYFQIVSPGDESSTERLPLKSSAAKVEIDGVIAGVRLTQRYANNGSAPIEAVYVFPASTRAAVHGMTLTVGERVIAARIRETEKAKAEYEVAKKERKTAALLEEHRPNVFQMSVANVLPGDDIEVAIEWTEVVPAFGAECEFVFPTVVGPRYTAGTAGETWTANPHLAPGDPAPAAFTMDVSLRTALPLAEVTSPSHPVAVEFKAKDRAVVSPAGGDLAADRDFILRWKLGNAQVDAGVLLHRGETENHFLLQIAPPDRVTPEQVTPRDCVFVLDVSGSMNGFPLETARGLMRDLAGEMREWDTFNLLTFASGSGLLSETPLPATRENIARALKFMEGTRAGGGTELGAALKRAFDLPGGEDRSRVILLITDGFVSADDACRNLVLKRAGSANVFTFGIGSSVNRHLLESVARAGAGEPVVVTQPSEAKEAARGFRESLDSPVLAKVRVEAEGVEISGVEPSPHPDVFATRPLVITGKWTGEPKGRLIVRGIAGGGRAFEKSIDLAAAVEAGGAEHPAVPVLWARERVRRLSEFTAKDAESVREITSLGLTYSLLTRYTAFVAVDDRVRETGGNMETVRQPLPMPAGVPASAIGGSPVVANGSVPEPGSAGLLALLAMLLAFQRRRAS